MIRIAKFNSPIFIFSLINLTGVDGVVLYSVCITFGYIPFDDWSYNKNTDTYVYVRTAYY